jgi:hypothetical protein
MPLRNMYAMTNGSVPRETVKGLIKAFNGKRGLAAALKAYVKHKKVKKTDIYG